jgi:hypothetical protein
MQELRSPEPPTLADTRAASAAAGAAGAPSAASPVGRTWMLISRYLLIFTYVFGVALSGWVIFALVRKRAENHEFAFAIAAIFVGLAVPISFHNMNQHMTYYVSPMQAQVLRVLWMVPVYQSWIALVNRALLLLRRAAPRAAPSRAHASPAARARAPQPTKPSTSR